jgi:transcriptional regulator of heat shock response
MSKVTNRQLKILKAMMDQFLSKKRMLVSSSIIVKQYDVDACAATVRNDMVVLEDKGFIQKPHVSAGRLPSTIGIKYFLTHLLQENKLPIELKESIKAKISTADASVYHMLEIALSELAKLTREATFLYLENIHITKNLYKLYKYPELKEEGAVSSILQMLEDKKHIDTITKHANKGVFAIVGEDLEYDNLEVAAIVANRFEGPKKGKNGLIGVISSKRVNYPKIIPITRTISKALQNSLYRWHW